MFLKIVDEGGHRFGQLPQQCTVVAQLIGVVVEPARLVTAQLGVVDADPQVGTDQLRDGAANPAPDGRLLSLRTRDAI